MKVYRYDSAGYYAGEHENPSGVLPHNATETPPEATEGHISRWTGAAWEQAENHKGEKGYVDGIETEIKEYGPLPAGWSLTPPPPTLEKAKEDKLNEIAIARFGQETGGVVFQGMTIDTSRESQSLITGAALQATIDSSYVCRWKTSAGFVELTSAMILAVAVAVRTHVQACFDREAGLLPKVAAAATVDDVNEITWQSAV